MRYYTIVLMPAGGGAPITFQSFTGQAFTGPNGPATLSSLMPGSSNAITGLSNPAALQVEFDLSVATANEPTGNGQLRVWGLGIKDIGHAANYNGCQIQIYAGMAKGLPLATALAPMAGLIYEGTVLQCYGTWYLTNQYIDFIVIPGGITTGSPSKPGNFAVNWQTGTPLSQALAATLSTAFPGVPQSININPNIVLNHPAQGHYATLQQLANAANNVASGILGADYPGLVVTFNAGTITVTDSTVPATATISINPDEIIGQPVWLQPGQISVKLVMRSDIHVGGTIILPPSIFSQGPGSSLQNSPNDTLTFSGSFFVNNLHYFGNFRQPDAASWNVTAQCVALTS